MSMNFHLIPILILSSQLIDHSPTSPFRASSLWNMFSLAIQRSIVTLVARKIAIAANAFTYEDDQCSSSLRCAIGKLIDNRRGNSRRLRQWSHTVRRPVTGRGVLASGDIPSSFSSYRNIIEEGRTRGYSNEDLSERYGE